MKRVIACFLTSAAAAPAAAQPYAAGEIGYAGSDFSLGAPFRGVIDDEGAMYGVNLGYRFSDLLAAEFGASWYGDFNGRGSPCPRGQACILAIRTVPGNDIRAYSASLIPGFDHGSFRFFAKAGYYRAEIDTGTAFPDDDFTREGWTLGAGVRWRFSESWSAGLEASVLGDEMEQLGVSIAWHP